MWHESKEEGMRWLMQAGRDLDDARYSFDGKGSTWRAFSLNKQRRRRLRPSSMPRGGDGPGAFCGQALETRSELRSG